MSTRQVDVEHILSFEVATMAPLLVPGAPHGTRGIIGVTGGTFEGPRLKGTVVPPSGDWFTVRPSGALKIDVRLALLTDDQTPILLTYNGVGIRAEEQMVIRVAASFEAPEGPYAWLNDLQAIGYGSLGDGSVRYEIFALT
jgi:hypothetical protein